MLKYVILYVAILMIIGIVDYFKVKNFEDFAVAGKKQTLLPVIMSLLATVIGASATLGVMGKVSALGFPAFWWLGVGAIGLIVQSIFLSEKIRKYNANTLPDLVNKVVGKGGSTIVAIIIAIAWPAIVASQILALTSLLALATGKDNNKTLLLMVAVIVILYTAIGGQLSVVKTDVLQFAIIGISIVATFIYLFGFADGSTSVVTSNMELLNDSFGFKDLLIQLFIVGGAYLLGPDIVSRNLVSKNGRTAKNSARFAALALTFFSIIIVMIGMWVEGNVTDLEGANPLLHIIKNILPLPIGVLLLVGLMSTLLSSADTCLINIASIIEHDILKRNKIWEVRGIVVIVGAISVAIAFYKADIIMTLLGAYSIYAPGVVCPLFIAIMAHGKRKINPFIWMGAVLAGGICGALLSYNILTWQYLPITGMGISLIIGLLSILEPIAIEKPVEN